MGEETREKFEDKETNRIMGKLDKIGLILGYMRDDCERINVHLSLMQDSRSFLENMLPGIYARMDTLEFFGPGIHNPIARMSAHEFFKRAPRDPGRSLENSPVDPDYSPYPISCDWD